MSEVLAVILAAGKGTRMRSSLPKVLHPVAGIPMVAHVLEAAQRAGVDRLVVVVGHGAELVEQCLGPGYSYVCQHQQLGTGHAVMAARERMDENVATVMVLCGDTPLLTASTLEALLAYHRESAAAATLLTAFPPDPTGYGRILRDADHNLVRIVEERDATPEEREIGEVNTGIYCFHREALLRALDHIQPANAQGEYYLTDVLEIMRGQGLLVTGMVMPDPAEMQGINDRVQLAAAEKMLRQRINRALMESGVTIIDPDTVWIDATVSIGRDTVIYPCTTITGQSRIGENSRLGPHTVLHQCTVGDGVEVRLTVAEQAVIGDHCKVGPFSYLRPGTVLETGVKVGDFVEIKQSTIGQGSKIPHLSYIGDTVMGREVNVGAGTITCNYDGRAKHNTVIHDRAFIGSNTNLVAPVTIGAEAVVGAGSTITRDVPAGALGVERAKQSNINGWAKRQKAPAKPGENG